MDAACPVSTGEGTRRVRLLREGGGGVKTVTAAPGAGRRGRPAAWRGARGARGARKKPRGGGGRRRGARATPRPRRGARRRARRRSAARLRLAARRRPPPPPAPPAPGLGGGRSAGRAAARVGGCGTERTAARGAWRRGRGRAASIGSGSQGPSPAPGLAEEPRGSDVCMGVGRCGDCGTTVFCGDGHTALRTRVTARAGDPNGLDMLARCALYRAAQRPATRAQCAAALAPETRTASRCCRAVAQIVCAPLLLPF